MCARPSTTGPQLFHELEEACEPLKLILERCLWLGAALEELQEPHHEVRRRSGCDLGTWEHPCERVQELICWPRHQIEHPLIKGRSNGRRNHDRSRRGRRCGYHAWLARELHTDRAPRPPARSCLARTKQERSPTMRSVNRVQKVLRIARGSELEIWFEPPQGRGVKTLHRNKPAARCERQEELLEVHLSPLFARALPLLFHRTPSRVPRYSQCSRRASVTTMPERLVRWSLGGVNRAASPKGVGEQGALARIKVSAAQLQVDPQDPAALIALLWPIFGAHVDRAQVVASPLGTVQEQDGDATETTWLTATSTGTARLDNGGSLALQDFIVASWGTRYPLPIVRLKGLALAAHGVGITAVDVWAWYCPTDAPSTWGSVRFATLVDDAAVPLPSLAPEISRISLTLQLATFVQVGTVAGVPLYAGEARMVAFSTTGLIWIRPGDVGNATWQIPATAANNGASHYVFFPSVFVRRAEYFRDLTATSPPDPDPVNTLAGALPLLQVDRAPSYSRWLVQVDGQVRTVIVAHPTGSDLRKPLEIWNSVWVAAIRTGSIATYDFVDAGPTRTFFQTGEIVTSAIVALDAAEFLEPLDGNTSPIWSVVPQT